MDVLKHHVKPERCTTRPKYREGKTPRSVRVYSVVNESKYLLVTNVPTINVDAELRKLFCCYGQVEEHKVLHEYPSVEFHEAVLIKFNKIQNARCAKIKLDRYNFFGSSLQVSYVPEYESIDDLREKLDERRSTVELKCKKYESMGYGTLKNDLSQESKNQLKQKNKKFPSNKKLINKNSSQPVQPSTSTDCEKKDPIVMYPELPAGWKKQTYTGDSSYDTTVLEVNKQLKRTMPSYDYSIPKMKKRKKILKL